MGSWSGLDLPGFRFHPTEEELLDFYLHGAVHGRELQPEIIRVLNLYHYDPWELPGLATIGEREWYFFVPRDRRSSNGGRPNRTTERGFWKATGSDRPIRSVSDPRRLLGLRKTLVFYLGRAPRGTRTNWVMNEYRLHVDGACRGDPSSPPPQKDGMVLCKVYLKATPLKELEQRAAADRDGKASERSSSTADSTSSSSSEHIAAQLYAPPLLPLPEMSNAMTTTKEMIMKTEMDVEKEAGVTSFPVDAGTTSGQRKLPELEVPPRAGFDWTQDPGLLRSPWLDNWSPYYATVFNIF